tara:strand:+ start:107 stop:856 length:750 start_codon:yes stop_codon:yes gene_type:complete
MRQGWQERTEQYLLRYFDKPGLDVAVVGNGPISHADRKAIAKASKVVRFNDVNNFWEGERTTLRVVRHPSWFTLKHVGAPTWHVVPTDGLAPKDAEIITGVYERQHTNDNILPDDSRLFPSCFCGDSCLQAKTWAGPSTGGVALSVLQELENVDVINVYGMNWNGPADMHIDFANRTMVRGCCTKCIIHPTANNDYGAAFFATSAGLVTIGGIVAFFVTGGTVTVAARKILHRHSREHETPLLGLKHPP